MVALFEVVQDRGEVQLDKLGHVLNVVVARRVVGLNVSSVDYAFLAGGFELNLNIVRRPDRY